jgi:hypothetical protein
MSQDAPLNPRTVSQSLQTAIEGTRAEAVLAQLSQDRKDSLMSALGYLSTSERDSYFQRFMGMTEASAPQLIDEAIAAGKRARGTIYTVQPGDSLSRIAKAHSLSLNAVLDANPQYKKNPDLIHPNDKITLPNN